MSPFERPRINEEPPLQEQEDAGTKQEPEPRELVRESADPLAARRETVQTPEFEETLERHRNGRLGLLKEIATSRVLNTALYFIPGIDVSKFAIEGIVGKTLGGHVLSGRKRFDHLLISGGLLCAYTLGASGMTDAAVLSGTATAIITKIELGPEGILDIAELIKSPLPKVASFLEKIGSYFLNKREEFFDGVRSIGPEVEKYLSEMRPELSPM